MAEEETPKPPEGGDKKKKGKLSGKTRWYIIGGVVVLGILFVAVRSSNKASNAADTSGPTGASAADQMGINPGTGYLYGSPADLAAQGSGSTVTGVPGPQGPPGPAGPAGPPAKPGKPVKTPLPIVVKKPPVARPVPKPVSHHYTVRPGDSLSAIATRYRIAGGWQALYNKNKSLIGKNPNMIHPGQRLVY